MIDSKILRTRIKDELSKIVDFLNCYLRGENVKDIKAILEKID
ncbi:hypothetical protein LCGC14_1844500 [marine sediment metagenome]|uniref:Uncharacterized protein n=1 Tax=marine sediment metagenome TaxID=412755 RepID=A0A0F9IRT6_9ZZZZ